MRRLRHACARCGQLIDCYEPYRTARRDEELEDLFDEWRGLVDEVHELHRALDAQRRALEQERRAHLATRRSLRRERAKLEHAAEFCGDQFQLALEDCYG